MSTPAATVPADPAAGLLVQPAGLPADPAAAQPAPTEPAAAQPAAAQPAPTELAPAQPAAADPAAAQPASRIAGQVAQFHRSFQLPVRTSPTAEIGAAQLQLRLDLIEEEVGELRAAAVSGDLTGVADALADIVYVAYGTAHVYGIDLDAVLDEVHSSNMTKLGPDGRPVHRADGKVLKGPGYRAPDVAGVLGRSS